MTMKYEYGNVVVVDCGVFKGEFIVVECLDFNGDNYYRLRPTNDQQKAIIEATLGDTTAVFDETDIISLV